MQERFPEWFKRASFPASSKVSLGWGTEYWNNDPTRYEGWEELQKLRAVPNPQWKDEKLAQKRLNKSLAHELYLHLLDEVIVAAGGVEHSVTSFRSSVRVLQEYCIKHHIAAAVEVPTGVSHASSANAWYEFANILFWSRSLAERLTRNPIKQGMPPQGLIPALNESNLKTEIQDLFNKLQKGPVGEIRKLTNFTLHVALVKHPYTGANVDEKGVVHLLIPNTPVGSVSHWHLLSWSQDRDGIIFIEELWQSVQEFMDAILDAFEEATPERLQRPTQV